MRAVIQRVSKASVTVESEVLASIGPGLLVLLGVGRGDEARDAAFLAGKVANLRLFGPTGGFDRSVKEVDGEVLVVSQFTLLADCRKGRRPSFDAAAPAPDAERLYRVFLDELASQGVSVAEGRFQAHMRVELVNDGPVTLILDSR